jgi:serine/threonine protein phosphatase PrpC
MRTVQLKNFDFASHTDIGRTRDRNEDFFAYFDSLNGHVFVVCDGMGGHNAGDVASELAVETVGNFFNLKFYANPFEALEQAMIIANQTVYNYSVGNDYLFGMGTTMVLILIREDKIYYGHAGDSRLYLFRNNILDQITADHSYVQQLLQKRMISQREAQEHPRRNEITKAIGLSSAFDPDISPKAIIPQNDDILLLCTDGLTNMISGDEISKILGNLHNLNEKAVKLIAKANKNGGLDNISVQIIKFHNLGDDNEPDLVASNKSVITLFRQTLKKKKNIAILLFFFLIGTLLFFISVDEPDLLGDNPYFANKHSNPDNNLIIAYHVKSGETLEELAQRFNTERDMLLRLNPNFDNFKNIKHLKIPVKGLYIVKKIDELPIICAQYDVEITDIMKANNICSLDLKVGMELIIPIKSK